MQKRQRQKRYPILSPLLTLLCAAFLIVGCAQNGNSTTSSTGGGQPQVPPPPPINKPVFNGTPPPISKLNLPHLHLFQVKTEAHADAGTLPLTYHKGSVMQTTSITYAIFWEPTHLQDGFPTHVSGTYNSLLERYFQDIGGSGLYNVNTQYYDTSGHIVNSSTFAGAWLDRSDYPRPGCFSFVTPHGCLSDAQIQAEVTKAMQANHWTGGVNHLFFVFTSWGEGSCAETECAFTSYCGYHSYYTANNQTIFYANMPYTGTLPTGCVIEKSPNNDLDADSTISVASHEQMEAVTDVHIDAWYDAKGYEIGDKCAWNFGKMTLDGGKANVQWNGHYYLVQQEWSNAIKGCTLSA